MKKHLLIRPYGGLCNRLRALISAQIVAERSERHLIVVWELHKGCNCRFDELFLTDLDVFHVGKLGKWLEDLKIGTVNRFLFGKAVERFGAEDLEALGRMESSDASVVSARSFSQFKPSTMPQSAYHRAFSQKLNALRPKRSIQAIIERFKRETFSENMIGVHVRRTDNVKSKQVSTDEMFMARMRSLLDEDPSSRFFLSTDSPATERKLAQACGDKIVSYKKRSRARDDKIGIQDGYIDLRLLGETRRVLGSYWSSFSEMACQFNNIPLEVVK